jgi:PhzF family phenazine biosynthesis protein
MKNAYRVYQVNSFTQVPFAGNPAGVVPNADGLTEKQMQLIARELNNSETAFIFQNNEVSAGYDAEVRFYADYRSTYLRACNYSCALCAGIRTPVGTR